MTALAGLRILDLTRLLPGPYCTQLLADLGADVVKIEAPGLGDPARHLDGGAFFARVNRNKRSATIDLRQAEGQALLLRLVGTADVLVESFRPGVMERLGVGYETLAARNPRLIYATLSGFGQSGPYRDRPAHDLNYLALAGIVGLNAPRGGGPPMPMPVQVADLGGGLLAAVAILAAVVARARTGRGQRVDCSLLGAALAWLPTLLAAYAVAGHAPAPGEPPLSGGLPQYDVYQAADGRYLALGALEGKFYRAFLERAGALYILDLEKAEQRAALARLFAGRTRPAWLELMADVDTCLAPVNTLDEALADPGVLATGLMSTMDGRAPRVGVPCSLSDTPGLVAREAPVLGEHTAEVLAEIGLDAAAVAALAQRGVV
jgi:alpha-methylacyl-CoA racemase